IDRRLENLHALSRDLRAPQSANQFFALPGEHRSDHDFDPAHVAFHNVHVVSPHSAAQGHALRSFTIRLRTPSRISSHCRMARTPPPLPRERLLAGRSGPRRAHPRPLARREFPPLPRTGRSPRIAPCRSTARLRPALRAIQCSPSIRNALATRRSRMPNSPAEHNAGHSPPLHPARPRGPQNSPRTHPSTSAVSRGLPPFAAPHTSIPPAKQAYARPRSPLHSPEFP